MGWISKVARGHAMGNHKTTNPNMSRMLLLLLRTIGKRKTGHPMLTRKTTWSLWYQRIHNLDKATNSPKSGQKPQVRRSSYKKKYSEEAPISSPSHRMKMSCHCRRREGHLDETYGHMTTRYNPENRRDCLTHPPEA